LKTKDCDISDVCGAKIRAKSICCAENAEPHALSSSIHTLSSSIHTPVPSLPDATFPVPSLPDATFPVPPLPDTSLLGSSLPDATFPVSPLPCPTPAQPEHPEQAEQAEQHALSSSIHTPAAVTRDATLPGQDVPARALSHSDEHEDAQPAQHGGHGARQRLVTPDNTIIRRANGHAVCQRCDGEGCRHCAPGDDPIVADTVWTTPSFEVVPNPPNGTTKTKDCDDSDAKNQPHSNVPQRGSL